MGCPVSVSMSVFELYLSFALPQKNVFLFFSGINEIWSLEYFCKTAFDSTVEPLGSMSMAFCNGRRLCGRRGGGGSVLGGGA